MASAAPVFGSEAGGLAYAADDFAPAAADFSSAVAGFAIAAPGLGSAAAGSGIAASGLVPEAPVTSETAPRRGAAGGFHPFVPVHPACAGLNFRPAE